MEILVAIGLFVVAFLLGSVPFGLIISKVFYHTDIREHGSGNIGTTNAIRTMGKAAGYSVFVLDFGKGLLSGVLAMLACWFLIPGGGLAPGMHPTYHEALAIAVCGCTLGHVFSPWLGFRGGKGIAVAIGCVFIALGPVAAILEILLFAVLVIATRYVSLGSVAAAVAFPFFSLYCFWGDWPAIVLCTVTALVVIWAHRGNIKRLLSGTERRIGDKRED